MNEQELVAKCKKYLNEKKLTYVDNPEISWISNNIVNVIFLRPEALDPSLVIDPETVVVSINILTGEMNIIEQM